MKIWKNTNLKNQEKWKSGQRKLGKEDIMKNDFWGNLNLVNANLEKCEFGRIEILKNGNLEKW